MIHTGIMYITSPLTPGKGPAKGIGNKWEMFVQLMTFWKKKKKQTKEKDKKTKQSKRKKPASIIHNVEDMICDWG